MKKIPLLSFLILFVLNANAENCFWAKHGLGYYDETATAIATDGSGNVYGAGYFSSSSLNLDSMFVLTNHGSFQSKDVYIIKYTPDGSALWAKNFGSDLDDECYGITTDAADNIYITGQFQGDSIMFDSYVLHNQVLGNQAFFIAKLDSSGNTIWAKTALGDHASWGYGVAVDATGASYVTGRFGSSSLDFGSVIIYNTDSTSGDFDIFIAKYNASGNISWAKDIRGSGWDDIGAGIATDAANNIFVTGSFNSDTLDFGGIKIPFSSGANEDGFIAKFDSGGNALWAHSTVSSGIQYSNGVASDGSNVFITGLFDGNTAQFGGTTLTNYGSADIFIAKYDPAGNPLWANVAGGYGGDAGYGIAADASGNVYLTGMFTGTSAFFGIDTLHNTSSLNEDVFIASYDAAGNLQWATSGRGDCRGIAIAVNGVDKVFFTGDYQGASMVLGSDTLNNTNSNRWDMFVASTYTFSAAVSSTNVNCNGGNDGTISVILTGGATPFSYSWNTGDSTQSVFNLTAGIYSVTVTDANECNITLTDTLTEPSADSAKICMVTVDSLSQYNIIIWDKTGFTTVDSFIVYREISTANYQPIASIPFDSLSEFVDTVRTLYFPNTGDPNAGTYRYKIQAHDTCGNYSLLSPYHNTIYFINNGGTFSWPQLYTIENDTNPVISYVLLRDDSSNGNWHAISSVAGTQQTVSDPQYSLYQNIASWRIETQWGITCTPTRSTGYSASLSNIYNTSLVGVNEQQQENSLIVYPNPSTGKFTIAFSGTVCSGDVQMVNMMGEKIYSGKLSSGLNSKTQITCDVPSGIYFLQIAEGESVYVRKVIVK